MSNQQTQKSLTQKSTKALPMRKKNQPTQPLAVISVRPTQKKKNTVTNKQQPKTKNLKQRQLVVRGRGAYTMNPEDTYGRQWGGYLGSKLGELAGGAAQGLATSFITGFGEYQNKSNALQPGLLAPIVNYNPHGGRIVRGCEYLGDIISSGTPSAFKLQNFRINPGVETSFPKLAQEAANFDEYVVEGMYFEFRSMTALTAANPYIGSVIMAANYNPIAPVFTAKGPMEEYDGAVSCRPDESCIFYLECERAQTLMEMLLVRTNDVPTGQDARFFDIANFQIASVGVPTASQNMGELWVSYQVALLKPKLFTSLGNNNTCFSYTNAVASNAAPFGTLRTADIVSPTASSGFSIDSGGTTITFPSSPLPQSYEFWMYWQGGAVAVTNPTRSLTNCNVATPLAMSADSPATGTTSTTCSSMVIITTLPNTVPKILIGTVTLPSAPFVFVSINQVPNIVTGV